MSPPEDTPQQLDELARKRAERASAGEPEQLRERVRDEARRSARRAAAAQRARRRAGGPPPGPDLPTGGGASGAA
ncbi:MAG TPA: hypothetical protein VK506_11105 [Conexibacter sp.]|nr:hypothetical protein [Conexibacter sp.]